MLYPLSRTPPFDTGTLHLTVMALPTTLVEVMIGALGNVRGRTFGSTTAALADIGPVPAALVAVIVKM